MNQILGPGKRTHGINLHLLEGLLLSLFWATSLVAVERNAAFRACRLSRSAPMPCSRMSIIWPTTSWRDVCQVRRGAGWPANTLATVSPRWARAGRARRFLFPTLSAELSERTRPVRRKGSGAEARGRSGRRPLRSRRLRRAADQSWRDRGDSLRGRRQRKRHLGVT